MEEYTYAKAGVDIKKVKEAHKEIAEILKGTFSSRDGKFGKVLSEIGHYAGLIDIGNNNVLALHADGVGTKTLIAEAIKKYDSVGIDCVAMCVNDLICMGAEPVSMIDYLALEKTDERKISEIVKGLVIGAKEAGISIVGGETAIMPDVIKGFDLSAMSVGLIEKDKIITGEKIKVGDVVIGLESSGIHSNGLTLARKVLLSKYKVTDYIPELKKSLGEELLEPTKIYVNAVLEIIKKCEVHGLANITGGAFSKLMRIGKEAGVGFELENVPEPQPIFKLIQKEGNVSDKEMYRTFNMGIGFCICSPESESKKINEICSKNGVKSRIIGKVVDKPTVVIKGIDVS